MPKEENAREPADPMELWEKWYETASRAWSNTSGGSKETYLDPFIFYRTWMKNVGKVQELMQAQLKAGSFQTIDPREAWKRWFETTTDFLEKSSARGADPFGLTTQWLEMIEEARARILADTNIPADPFTLMKQWYDATNESWATVIGDIIGTEKFMESAGQFLESYASLYKTFSRANEEFFSNLQLPTRSDIARVAELVIEVENKVESIEDALEVFEDNYARTIPGNLEERLEQVERKLDALPDTFQKLATVDGLEKRLDRVESKLDKLLVALEKIESKELPKSFKTTNPNNTKAQAARRKSSKGQALPVEAESVSRRTK
jgi:polyhydroxyalkanoic acid synthase PhaR subunit